MHVTSTIFEFQIVRPNGQGMPVLERYRDDALCCDKALWLDHDGAQREREFGSGAVLNQLAPNPAVLAPIG